MNGRVLALLVGIPAALVLHAGPASAVGAPGDLSVSIEPATATVVLGDTFDVQVSVTNATGAATEPLAVHLDVTDPAAETSVDPEDWTPTLNRTVGSVAAGETATVRWALQPIAGGTFAVYAVALSQGSDSLAASNVHLVTVQEQRSLNPSGILPLAVGAPALVGALLLVQVRRSRRR